MSSLQHVRVPLDYLAEERMTSSIGDRDKYNNRRKGGEKGSVNYTRERERESKGSLWVGHACAPDLGFDSLVLANSHEMIVHVSLGCESIRADSVISS